MMLNVLIIFGSSWNPFRGLAKVLFKFATTTFSLVLPGLVTAVEVGEFYSINLFADGLVEGILYAYLIL